MNVDINVLLWYIFDIQQEAINVVSIKLCNYQVMKKIHRYTRMLKCIQFH